MWTMIKRGAGFEYQKGVFSSLPSTSFVLCVTDDRHFAGNCCVFVFQIKLHENSCDRVSVSYCGPLLVILFHVKSNRSALILSYLPILRKLVSVKVPRKQPVRIKLPHAYMTEVGLGRIQALGPK